jgi:hypothetical protein
LRGPAADLGVDRITVFDDRGDQLPGECRRVDVTLLVSQMPLEDRVGRPLTEIRLEDRRKGEPATGPPAADTISPRRHRPAR